MHCTCGHHFDWKRAPWYWRHSKSALLATLGLLLAAVLALLLAFDLLFTCLAAAQGWTQLSQTSSAFQSLRLAVSAAEQALRVGCLATSWVGAITVNLGSTLLLRVLPAVAAGVWDLSMLLGGALYFIGASTVNAGSTLLLRVLPAVAVGV